MELVNTLASQARDSEFDPPLGHHYFKEIYGKLIRDKIPVLAQLDANILKIRRPKSTAELLDFIKNKVIEETTELFDAIDQYNEDDLSTVNHIIEEFADVYTILYRLVTFFNIDVETMNEKNKFKNRFKR